MHSPLPRLGPAFAALLAMSPVAFVGIVAECTFLEHDAFAAGKVADKEAAARDLERARVLDQQGVRAYKEERYNDAIRYFVEARKLGGPSSELWNIAKCHVHLDQPEEASHALEEYLATPGLSAGDRTEATEQLREIKRRHSTLTVASSPSGATVYLDGRHGSPAGTTPLSVDVAPGDHAISIEHPGYEPYTKEVDAAYGRAIIVDAQLSKKDDEPPPPHDGKTPAHVDTHPHRLILEAELGVSFPRFGGVGGNAGVAGLLGAGYVLHDAHNFVFALGARLMIAADGWSSTVGAPAQPAGCGTAIPNKESATAFSAFIDGAFGYRIGSRFRVGGDLGLGVAAYSLDVAGGDVFDPTCRPAPGAKPAMHLGAEGSYAFTREVRLVVTPLFFEAQPAFDGTRSAPKDASAAWLRFGAGLGLAFDLF